jgi:glycosyltransferase involved in cell wall biosynthesis
MKIKIVTYANYPFGGASANFVRLLAKGLFENNSEIKVVLPTGHYFGNERNPNKKKINTFEGIQYQYLGCKNHPKNVIGKILDIAIGFVLPIMHFLNNKNKTDIIILYHISFITILPFLIVKIFSKQKLVLVLPEFYEKPQGGFYKPQLINWYNFYFGIKYFLGKVDGFIVLTNYLKNYIDKRYGSSSPILIIPNLIDPNVFIFSQSSESDLNTITIGYVGTPTRKDGIDDLIDSFALLANKYNKLRLLIIGDITNGNTIIPALKLRAKNLNIENKIVFTGLVDYHQIPQLLSTCQILALTRPNGIFAEAGFPTKLGEYFSTKKPIVITNIGDIPNYFTNEKELIIVEAENIDSIVKGFEKIILNLEEAEFIGKRGYDWMMEHLHYKKCTKKINIFLESLLDV